MTKNFKLSKWLFHCLFILVTQESIYFRTYLINIFSLCLLLIFGKDLPNQQKLLELTNCPFLNLFKMDFVGSVDMLSKEISINYLV